MKNTSTKHSNSILGNRDLVYLSAAGELIRLSSGGDETSLVLLVPLSYSCLNVTQNRQFLCPDYVLKTSCLL